MGERDLIIGAIIDFPLLRLFDEGRVLDQVWIDLKIQRPHCPLAKYDIVFIPALHLDLVRSSALQYRINNATAFPGAPRDIRIDLNERPRLRGPIFARR